MKKTIKLIFLVSLVLLACTFVFTACVEITESGDENDSAEGEGNNITDSIKDKIEEVIFGSYEEILNEYSQKLRNATPKLIEEYNEEAKSNQDGLIGLATICNNKVSKLAEISMEGVQEMAQLLLEKGNGSYDEYSEWAGKLQDVYMEEAAKIQEVYMDSAR